MFGINFVMQYLPLVPHAAQNRGDKQGRQLPSVASSASAVAMALQTTKDTELIRRKCGYWVQGYALMGAGHAA